MGTKYLLDTNCVIYLLSGKVSIADQQVIKEAGMDRPHISVITQIELLSWSSATPSELKQCQLFVDNTDILGLTKEVVDKTIWARQLKFKPKLPDCIIAATALVHDMVLLTANEKDFNQIPGLKVINPFVL